MNEDATRNTNKGMNGPNGSALLAKSARKETIKANPNRVKWRALDISQTEKSRPNTVKTALDEHKELLLFLVPALASLPSTTFTPPAEDLASLALSAAVLYKNACEKLTRTKNSPTLPKSVPKMDFELQASNRLKKKDEFKVLVSQTDTKISEFKDYLRGQILKSQELEIKESIVHLQKTTIHYSLLLSNHLVRFFKTLYSKTLLPDASKCSNEHILAQDAVRTIFSGILNEFIHQENETPFQDEIDELSNQIIKKNKESYSKFLCYLHVNDYNDLVILFNKFVYKSKMKDTSVVEKGKNREPSSSISSSSSDSTSTKPSVADTATTITDDTTTTSSLTEGPTLISPTRPRITSPYTKKISCNVATPEKSTNANKYGTNTDTPNSIATTTTNTDASQTIIPNSHVHIAPVNRRDLPPSVSNVAPPSKPSSTRYTEMDTKIINYVMPILHKLLPLLTVTVFERYEEEA